MWEFCRKEGMVSSAEASAWRAGMDWGVGHSGVKGLKCGLGKHGVCRRRWRRVRLYRDVYMVSEVAECW